MEKFSLPETLSAMEVDTPQTIMDSVLTTSKNARLDDIQIANIGIGLYGDSPFSVISGATNTIIGFDRINQSFEIILGTVLGEVPMLPILGSNVPYLLFEQADEIMGDTLELYVTEALNKLEPRVRIMSTNVSFEERDQNKVGITVEYRLTNTNIVRVFRTTIVTENGGDVL